MRPRVGAIIGLFVLAVGAANAQTYPGIAPVPATTDRAVLRARASEREIVERIRLGIAALGSNDFTGARDQFASALERSPREPQGSTAFYDLGLADAGLGRSDRAAEDFRHAIERDPGFLAARANLVAVLLGAGDLAGARRAAGDLVALAPDSARALYGRGLAALRAGDAAAAQSDFRKLLANDPRYAVAHYDLALAESKLGNDAEAEREYRSALALAPRYSRASIALGAILLREGKRGDARAAFDDAIRTSDDVGLRILAQSLRDAIVQ